MQRFALAVLVAVWLLPASADTLLGKVVAVIDGDTVTVLDEENAQHRIRLSGIDAPEKSQPFGETSKHSLSDLAFGRLAAVEWNKLDKYGRVVGKIVVDGRDINLEQIRRGLAWHYKKYASEQESDDREVYAKAEAEARVAKRGLWAELAPMPPWEWRHRP